MPRHRKGTIKQQRRGKWAYLCVLTEADRKEGDRRQEMEGGRGGEKLLLLLLLLLRRLRPHHPPPPDQCPLMSSVWVDPIGLGATRQDRWASGCAENRPNPVRGMVVVARPFVCSMALSNHWSKVSAAKGGYHLVSSRLGHVMSCHIMSCLCLSDLVWIYLFWPFWVLDVSRAQEYMAQICLPYPSAYTSYGSQWWWRRRLFGLAGWVSAIYRLLGS